MADILSQGLNVNSQYEMLFAERVTGPESLITVDGNLAAVKNRYFIWPIQVLGRLFDIDVMANGQTDYQLSREELGFGPRLCLDLWQSQPRCAKEQNHVTLDE